MVNEVLRLSSPPSIDTNTLTYHLSDVLGIFTGHLRMLHLTDKQSVSGPGHSKQGQTRSGRKGSNQRNADMPRENPNLRGNTRQ